MNSRWPQKTFYPVTNKCKKSQSLECKMSFEKIQASRLGTDRISDHLRYPVSGWVLNINKFQHLAHQISKAG